METEQKKEYTAPSLKVVELKHKPVLLEDSGVEPAIWIGEG